MSIDPSIGPLTSSEIPPEASPPIEGTTVIPAPVPMPTNPAALVEIVARGLAPDADPAARDAAWQVWTRFSPMISALTRSMPGAVPSMPVPSSSVAPEALSTVRSTPEQAGELLITMLRSRLPPGTELPPPRGFNVQIVKPR